MSGGAGPGRVALAGTLGFALLAAANGLDRATATNPALARLVPGWLASEAWRAQAAQALSAADFATAGSAAEAAVVADPIDPRSTALLGAAQLGGGQMARADRTFRVAAQFGWRDPLTQLYFMNAALKEGQPRLAALRLDAVLRQAPSFPMRETLLAQFAASPGGPGALAERLALRPAWTEEFLGEGNTLPLGTLQARAAIVAAVPGPGWGCDKVAAMVTRLVLQGGLIEAKALWRAHCPDASTGIADPRFARLDHGRDPVAFEWNLIGSGDISARPSNPPGSGLLVRLGGPSARPVAWQLLTLAPGRYRLSWTAATGNSAADNATVSLSCGRDDRQPVQARALDGAGRFAADIAVDGTCPGQFLVLWLSPVSDETRFDRFAVSPR